MATTSIRPATAYDAAELAANMRPADVAEVRAAGGYTPLGALEDALLMSNGMAWALRVDGQIMAMFGLVRASFVPDELTVWALTSTLVDRKPKVFMKASKNVIGRFRRLPCSALVNWVDARHGQSLRWAKKIGFTVDPPAPYGLERLPFHKIHMGGA